MEYRGYRASYAYDEEDEMYVGRVEGIRDVITFEAETEDEVEAEFRASVDEYLAHCEEQGIEPAAPSSDPS